MPISFKLTTMNSQNARRVCPDCEDELGHTAYVRHRDDTTGRICPSKSIYIEHDYRERSPRGINLDSSFDFESASDKSDDNNESSVSLSHISVAQDNASDSSKFDNDSDDSFSSEGEEVWDEMELSEEENKKLMKVIQ